MSALLHMAGVEAAYGSAQALFGVDLTVGEGEVVALLGRNGMGKTTTIRVATAMMAHSAGTVDVMGAGVAGHGSHRIARRGVGLVPEGRRCFAPLTVRENCMAAARKGAWDFARVTKLFPRLAERTDQRADTLSGGEQQMLAIARALMTNPRLLILDEATEGLAPVIRQEIWSALAGLKDTGLAILIVDKTLDELLKVADRCTILEKGATVWTGNPAALDEDLRDRYLGI